jgi:hypothetical protein
MAKIMKNKKRIIPNVPKEERLQLNEGVDDKNLKPKTFISSDQIKRLKFELGKRFWVGFCVGLGIGLLFMAIGLYITM